MLTDDMIMQKIQKYQQKTPRISNYGDDTGYKINIQKSITFLYTSNEQVAQIRNTNQKLETQTRIHE